MLKAVMEIQQHQIKEAIIEWVAKRTSAPVADIEFYANEKDLINATVEFELPEVIDPMEVIE